MGGLALNSEAKVIVLKFDAADEFVTRFAFRLTTINVRKSPISQVFSFARVPTSTISSNRLSHVSPWNVRLSGHTNVMLEAMKKEKTSPLNNAAENGKC